MKTCIWALANRPGPSRSCQSHLSMEPYCAGSYQKTKRGRPDWPSPFSQRVDETRRKKLEAEAQTKLDLSRRIALRIQHAPAAWIRNILSGVGEHQVVENVKEEELELGGETLRDSNVLLHAEIHIPVGQPANCSLAGAIAAVFHAPKQ